MGLFVLLWGSAAIFTRWALDHGSASAVLLVRYAVASIGLAVLVSLTLLGSIHWLAGTPEILRTIAVPMSVTAVYATAYNLTLRRSAGTR